MSGLVGRWLRCLKAMIERIALDALALRSQLPDLRLREGASVVARVAARQAEHGVIVLAGAPLVAKLPPEVEAGQVLHLKVAEVTSEQVTLPTELFTTPIIPSGSGDDERARALEGMRSR